jgi:hypothetical protein
MMPEINIDIDLWCSCGAGLCNQSSVAGRGQGFVVEPCENCLDKQYEQGKDDGYDKGFKEGYYNGFQEGLEKAQEEFDKARGE